MSKYYAVKHGRHVGLYSNWTDCKAQTSGFSGAVFKSFLTKHEALNYLYDGNVPPELMEEKSSSLISQARTIQNNEIINELPKIEINKQESKLELPIMTPGKKVLECDRSVLESPIENRRIFLYVDGSKRPSINHRGSSCYCRFLNQDYCMSLPISKEITAKYQINDEDYDKLSSPTLEYIAFSEVLWHFIQFRVKEEEFINEQGEKMKRIIPLNPRLTLLFISDYLGVKCFTDGTWVPEKDYIRKIRDTCLVIINFLKEKGVDVYVHHVKGHTGVLGNEIADVLAKSPQYFNNIPDLVKEITSKFL